MKKMHKVKVTVLKRFKPSEVFEKSPATFVDPLGACEWFEDGQEFISKGGGIRPEGFPCTNAWLVLYSNAKALSFGADMPWFEEKGVAVNCCPDGLRPVIFKLERI